MIFLSRFCKSYCSDYYLIMALEHWAVDMRMSFYCKKSAAITTILSYDKGFVVILILDFFYFTW